MLNTVKWLGDVYAMPIEAIQCQLFEDGSGKLSLTFERLLPLKSDDAFDLTIKEAEEKKVVHGTTRRRPAILKTLLENGLIEEGQYLWLHPDVFIPELRHHWVPTDTRLRITLDLSTGKPLFRWDPGNGAEPQLLSPSMAWFPIFEAVVPGRYTNPVGSPVYNHYSIEPGGPTLEKIALENDLW